MSISLPENTTELNEQPSSAAEQTVDTSSADALPDSKEKFSLFKNIHFHSIRTRGLVIGTGITLLAVLLAVGAYTFSLGAYYFNAIRSSLEAKAQTSSSFFTGYLTKTYAEYYQSAFSYAENFEDKDTIELQFLNTDGKVEISSTGFSSGVYPQTEDISQALTSGKISSWQGIFSSTGERILAVSAPLIYSDGSTVGIMRYVTSLRPIIIAVSYESLIALGIGILVVALVFFSNLVFVRSITRPISSLTNIAQRIAEGSYGVQLEKQNDDEIGELTDAINDMSQKLSKSERLQTEFVSSVSHELRTPLTAITGWSETISFDENMLEESRRGVEIIRREAARLTKMVEELLEYTRIQDGRFTLHVSTVDIPALVEDCLYTYNELLRHENMTVSYYPPEIDIPELAGDPERLSQVFLNILDNACKYGKSGKKIDIAIDMDDDFVTASFRDYGHGIPPHELPHVKEKFYKGSSKERGSGIGLAICEEIVVRHGGHLNIVNAEGGGVCVAVQLPIKS